MGRNFADLSCDEYIALLTSFNEHLEIENKLSDHLEVPISIDSKLFTTIQQSLINFFNQLLSDHASRLIVLRRLFETSRSKCVRQTIIITLALAPKALATHWLDQQNDTSSIVNHRLLKKLVKNDDFIAIAIGGFFSKDYSQSTPAIHLLSEAVNNSPNASLDRLHQYEFSESAAEWLNHAISDSMTENELGGFFFVLIAMEVEQHWVPSSRSTVVQQLLRQAYDRCTREPPGFLDHFCSSKSFEKQDVQMFKSVLKFSRGQDMTAAVKSCTNCGSVEARDGSKLLKCSSCLVDLYCSKDCQRIAWRRGHKKVCKPMTPSDSKKGREQALKAKYTVEDMVTATPSMKEMLQYLRSHPESYYACHSPTTGMSVGLLRSSVPKEILGMSVNIDAYFERARFSVSGRQIFYFIVCDTLFDSNHSERMQTELAQLGITKESVRRQMVDDFGPFEVIAPYRQSREKAQQDWEELTPRCWLCLRALACL